jgi:hypothetical protein
MSRVIYFDDYYDYDSNDIIIVDDITRDDFFEYYNEFDIKPKKLISTQMKSDAIIFLFKYIQLKENGDNLIYHKESLDLNLYSVMENLIENVNIYNLANLHKLAEQMSCNLSKNSLSVNRLEKLIELYEKFLINLAIPFFQSTPFLEKTLTEKISQHWLNFNFEQNIQLNSFIMYLSNLKQIPYFDVQMIDSILLEMSEYNNILNTFNTASIDEKLFIMSAYFFSVANYYYDKYEFNISLVFIHRSLDTYFQYLGKSENKIKFVSGSLMYLDNDKKIYLLKTKNKLTSTTLDSVQTSFLEEINNMRNYLACTHSVFSVKKDDIENYITKTTKLIQDIESNTRWQTISDTFYKKNLFKHTDIFMFDISIEDKYQEIIL